MSSIDRTPATKCLFFLFSDMKEPPLSHLYLKYIDNKSWKNPFFPTKKSVCDLAWFRRIAFYEKTKNRHMKYSRRCFVMKYRQNPLPIARRYRLLKSAKADGDVRIGKYPGLVSSPAQAFPDCSSDMICADSSLQWRDRFGFEEPLINSAPSSQHIFFALSASTNPPHSLCYAFGLSP